MIGRKSLVALAVLCALAGSAVSVASASAATKAFTCSKEATKKDRFGAHCLAEGATKEWGHIEVPAGKTATTATNANTASETTAAATSVLAVTIAGVATEIQCTGLEGSGTMENTESKVASTGTVSYTGCTVTKPAGKGCVVSGGKVTTKELTGESEGATIVKIKPAAGETIATVVIEKCSITGLNNSYPVTGSLKASVSGATATTTEAGVTEQATLKFGGQKAGLGGSVTDKGPNGNAIVLT